MAKTPTYKKKISNFINLSQDDHVVDKVNLEEERPVVMFGPHVEEVDSSTPPFYVSLLVYSFILHTCMLDSRASHNLMPFSVMKQLNLHITKPYKDIYSFDSKNVKCVGVIKDLVVSLAQILARRMVMEVVVVDIRARLGMLLSRSWREKLGGVLKFDFTYATIPVFGGEERRLYRETRFIKSITKERSSNSPMHRQEKDDFSCFVLQEAEETAKDKKVWLPSTIKNEDLTVTGVWKLYFDGAYSRDGSGVGIFYISPKGHFFPFCYRLEFDSTNNITEYEALVLGLGDAKVLGVQCVSIFGESEFVVKQIKNQRQTKNPRLREYRN